MGVALDEVGVPFAVGGGAAAGSPALWLQVTLRGNTRTLRISERIIATNLEAERETLRAYAQLEGVGVSLGRSGLRELAYLSLQRLQMGATLSSLATKAEIEIGDIRLDNQILTAVLPAVLIRSSLIAAKRGLFNEEEGGAPSAAGALAGLTSSSAAAKEAAAHALPPARRDEDGAPRGDREGRRDGLLTRLGRDRRVRPAGRGGDDPSPRPLRAPASLR